MEKVEKRKGKSRELEIVTLILVCIGALILVGVYLLCVNSNESIASNNSDIRQTIITSMVTIFGFNLAVMGLGLNLNQNLPQGIIHKYFLLSKDTWGYLVSQAVLIILVTLMCYYPLNIPATLTLTWMDLNGKLAMISFVALIVTTLLLFRGFLSITNKDRFYKEILEERLVKEINELGKSVKFSIADARGISVHSLEGNPGYSKISFEYFNDEVKGKNEVSYTCDYPGVYTHFENALLKTEFFDDRVGLVDIDDSGLEVFLHGRPKQIKSIIFKNKNSINSKQEAILEMQSTIKDEKERKEVIVRLRQVFKVRLNTFEALSDLITCIMHSGQLEPEELGRDLKFLEEILSRTNAYQSQELIDVILYNLNLIRSNNSSSGDLILKYFLGIAYNVNFNSHKIDKLIDLSDFLTMRILTASENADKEYMQRYEIALLYISEQIKFQFLEKFEREENVDRLMAYHKIVKNTINNGNRIIMNTLTNYFRKPTFYERYLMEQLSQFTKMLECYYDEPYDFNARYYELVGTEKELIDAKCKLVSYWKEDLGKKIASLYFWMMHLVEKNQLEKRTTEFIFDFGTNGNYEDRFLSPSEWLFESMQFSVGAIAVPPFPNMKYLAVLLFYQTKNRRKLSIPKKEDAGYKEELKESIKSLRFSYINRFIDLNEAEFEDTKKSLLSQV